MGETETGETTEDVQKAKRLRPTTIVLLLILLALILTPVWTQNKLIYKVVRYSESDRPGVIGPEGKDYTPFRAYTASDGLKNYGALIEPETAPETLPFPAFYICFGGNGTSAHGYQEMYQTIANETGHSFFLPDYRGFGFNEGKPSESGIEADALGVYDTLKAEGWFENGVGVSGMSLGGGPALLVTHGRKVDRLILMATFTSMDEMAAAAVPWPIYLMCWNDWPNEERLGEILQRAPGERPAEVFVMHGKRDDLVPFEMGKRLGNLPGEGLTFMVYDQANHLNLMDLSYDDYVGLLGAQEPGAPDHMPSSSQ